MCLAMPAQIVEITGRRAQVTLLGNVRQADLSLLEGAEVGDWVLVHAGFAIERLSQEDARQTLELLAAIDDHAGTAV